MSPGGKLSRILRTLCRLVATLTVLVLGTAMLALAPVRAAQPPKAHNDTRAVGSAPVTVDFPIQYFGIVADLAPGVTGPRPQGNAPFGEARFRVDGHWTDWQILDQDGAQAEGQFTGSLISVDEADAYQVRNVPAWARNWRAAAINTSSGTSNATGNVLPTASAATVATCRSRADWGADESISGWVKDGDAQTYAPAQVLTVHHTAGSNNLDQDYAATVRAIYSFHVTSNLWSDIGYQYLIDGHGVVYEGRNAGPTSRSCLTQSGDGSDFAHQSATDSIVTGAHAQLYNTGNIGISLMGCFESTSACSGDTTPPAAAVDSLENQLALLSSRHGLNPTGMTHYVNPATGLAKSNATVSGHRDWNDTSCPGGTLYAQLPTIRTVAAARMTTPQPAAAQITSASCRGATCTFNGTGEGMMSWNLGAAGPTVKGSTAKTTYTAAGTYRVTLTDSQPTSAIRTVTCTKVKKAVTCTVA